MIRIMIYMSLSVYILAVLPVVSYADLSEPNYRICDDFLLQYYENTSYDYCEAPDCTGCLRGKVVYSTQWMQCLEDYDTKCPTSCVGDSYNSYEEWECEECPWCDIRRTWVSDTCYVCSDNLIPD